MESLQTLGHRLDSLDDMSERSLVGHALALGVAFLDETGCAVKQIEEIIANSKHEIPKNVAGRLADLRKNGFVTPRPGSPQRWKLTPGGARKFGDIAEGLAAVPAQQRFLSIAEYPDNFYEEIIGQLNRAYQVGLYPMVLVWARKVLENLVIDLLRRRFTMTQVSIWYDTDRGRFRDFAVLCDELKGRLADFKPISGSFDQGIIRKLEQFRESGNSRAHSIEILTPKAEVDKLRDDLAWLVQIFTRALSQMKV